MPAQSCPTLRPQGLQPTRLLCPWDSPGKNTGGGCHSLLQGIFPTRGLNPPLLSLLQVSSLPVGHLGSLRQASLSCLLLLSLLGSLRSGRGRTRQAVRAPRFLSSPGYVRVGSSPYRCPDPTGGRLQTTGTWREGAPSCCRFDGAGTPAWSSGSGTPEHHRD